MRISQQRRDLNCCVSLRARTSISSCPPTRAMMPSTILDTTRAVSYRLSFTPSWISCGPRNIGVPPRVATDVSDATRVRVDRFENMIATLLPVKDCSTACESSAVDADVPAIFEALCDLTADLSAAECEMID